MIHSANMQYITIYKIFEYVMDRPIVKKDIYLAQKIGYITSEIYGAYLGDYIWGWRKNSPYSGSLALLINDYLEREINSHTYKVKNHLEPKLNELKDLFFNKRPENYSFEEWVKLITYTLYQWNIQKDEHWGRWRKIKNQGKEKVMHFIGDKLFVLENCPYKRREITFCTNLLLEFGLIKMN